MRNRAFAIGVMALWALVLAIPGLARGEDQPAAPGKKSLGIGAVKPTPSVVEAARRSGTLNQMNGVVQAMDSQLLDHLHNTRKFTLVARTDLPEILKEQGLAASGNIDADDAAAAQAFKLAGCQYLLITTIDGFQEYTEKATFEGTGEKATRSTVEFSAVAKIYDTTTGKLLESANLQVGKDDVAREPSYVQAAGTEPNWVDLARMMSARVADRVVDVLYPAKILARTDRTVTINRGDGTGIAAGQLWEVFALGQELIDPDTNASLGREEVKVGVVRITSVQPLTARGEVLEDRGVDKGQVLRPVMDRAAMGDPRDPRMGPPGGPDPRGRDPRPDDRGDR